MGKIPKISQKNFFRKGPHRNKGYPSRKLVNMDREANGITELTENNQGHKSVSQVEGSPESN